MPDGQCDEKKAEDRHHGHVYSRLRDRPDPTGVERGYRQTSYADIRARR
jgi:hypothetical protein